MPDPFYDFVDRQVQVALPANTRHISTDKLLGTEPCRIRHAFFTTSLTDKPRLVNLLVLPQSFPLTPANEEQLIRLRDYIIERNCILVVIYEEEKANASGDLGIFVEDTLAIVSPGLLRLRCAREDQYQTSLGLEKYDLHEMIHHLWNGRIRYVGPAVGEQTVLLEIMADNCYKCKKPMRTVTGLAFPDRLLSRWDNEDWCYYQQLLSLSVLEQDHALAVERQVDKLRLADPLITPVEFRRSKMAEETYFAAICPHCEALRGDFFVTERRMEHLHSFDSRISGELQYFPFTMRVDNTLLTWLWEGFESCPHACDMGWQHKEGPGLLPPHYGN